MAERNIFLISPSTSWEGKAIVGKEFCAKLKVGLKLNIQKTKIMASGPIISWQIDGETVADFILGGSKITADGDCSHEIKRHCFPIYFPWSDRTRCHDLSFLNVELFFFSFFVGKVMSLLFIFLFYFILFLNFTKLY